jgi:hypothetical protein
VRVQQVRAEHNPCRSHAREDRENQDVVIAHATNDSKKRRLRSVPPDGTVDRIEGFATWPSGTNHCLMRP